MVQVSGATSPSARKREIPMTDDRPAPFVDVESLLANAGWVRALARGLVGRDDLADDVVQETWLAAIESPPRHAGALRSWLRSVVRFTAHRVHREEERRSRREHAAAPSEGSVTPTGDLVSEVDLHRRVVEAALALDEPYRATVLLRYFRGCNAAEIGAMQGVPPATVRTRLRRALAQLRETLVREHPGEPRDLGAGLLLLAGLAGAGGIGVAAASASAAAASAGTAASTSAATAPIVTGVLVMTKAKLLVATLGVVAALVAGIVWYAAASRSPSPPPPVVSRETHDTSRDDLAALATPPPATPAEPSADLAADAPSPVGRVVHVVTRAAIAGAEISLLRRSDIGTLEEIVRTRSDASGRFALRGTHGSFTFERGDRIHAEAEGFVPRDFYLQNGFPSIVELAPGIRVTGEVLDPDGRPVTSGEVTPIRRITISSGKSRSVLSGRRLAFYYDGLRDERPIPLDRNGRFATTLVTPLVAFQARAPGFAPACSDVVRPDPARPTHVVIRLAPAHVLTGRVVDEAGEPIAGATLSCRAATLDREPDRHFESLDPWRWSAVSDADGAFRIPDFPERCVTVWATHPEYRTDGIFGPRDADTPVTVVMEHAQWVTGRLLTPGGEPAPEGRVVVRVASEQTIPLAAGGAFHSKPIPLDVFQGTVECEGYAPIDIRWEPAPGAHDLGELRLEAGSSIDVRVVDDLGEPVASASVAMSVQRETPYFTQRAVACADADGRAALTGIGATQVRLHVTASGHRAWSGMVSVSDGDEPAPAVTVALERTATVRGTVVSPDGAPLFGVEVTTTRESDEWRPSGARGDSLPDGSFVVSEMPPGMALLLQFRGMGRPVHVVPIDPLTPGEERDLGALTLPNGMTVTGEVRDDAGAPVEGAAITVSETVLNPLALTNMRTQWARSDSAGAFTLEGLGAGKVSFTCYHPDYLEAPPLDFTIDAAGGDRVDFVLVRGVPYEAIVVNEAGEPVEGAQILLRGPSDGRAWISSGDLRTDAAGRFREEKAPIGAVRLGVHHENYLEWETAAASVAELPRTITLARGASLALTVTMEGGEPPPGSVLVNLEYERGSYGARLVLRDGEGVLSGLEPGAFGLRVRVQDYPATDAVPVTLVPGEVTPVIVRIPRREGPVTIHVTGPADEPVVGARIELYDLVGRSRNGIASGETDDRGIYVARWLAPNTEVHVGGVEGYGTAVIGNAAAQVRNGVLAVRLERCGSSLEVRAVDANGRPVEGIRTRLVSTGEGQAALLFGSNENDARFTGSDGRARYDGLCAGGYRLFHYEGADQLGDQTITLADGEHRAVEIALAAPIPITGVVLENGVPVAGGNLTVRRGGTSVRATLTPDGAFSLAAPGPGTYHFTYRTDSSYWSEEWFAHDEIREIRGPAYVEIRFATATVRGVVLDCDGTPLAGAAGALLGKSEVPFTTDGRGRFTIEGVPVGEYRWTFEEPPEGCTYDYGRFRAEGNTEATYRFLPASEIEVIVTVKGGGTPEKYSVSCLREQGRYYPNEGSGPNRYVWPAEPSWGMVTARGYAPAAFFVEDPARTPRVEVVLEPGGELRVRILDSDGAPVDGQHPFRVDPLGEASLHELAREYWTWRGARRVQLAPGAYRVSTTLPNGEPAAKDVSIAIGTTTEVELP